MSGYQSFLWSIPAPMLCYPMVETSIFSVSFQPFDQLVPVFILWSSVSDSSWWSFVFRFCISFSMYFIAFLGSFCFRLFWSFLKSDSLLIFIYPTMFFNPSHHMLLSDSYISDYIFMIFLYLISLRFSLPVTLLIFL